MKRDVFFRVQSCHSWLFLLVFAVAARAEPSREELIAMGKKPEPPSMFKREIVKPTTAPAGEQIEIVDGEYKPTLFIPAAYTLPADGHVNLTVHFHGDVWFSIQEHLRRGLSEPLLIAYFGQGSAVYGKPFATDPERFGRFVKLAEEAITKSAAAKNGQTAKAHVTQIDLTSFSAGYGSVREILRQETFIPIIRRVVLCDSLYASWDPATTQPGATSRPALENMQPFEKFVRMAARGEKTFVLVHSSVPTPYANTVATAKYLAELVDAPHVDIAPNSTPPSSDPDYPLLYRADLGHMHLWGYGGIDGQAHMTQVRHLADVWKALDACGDR